MEFAHANLDAPNWSDVERSALVARSLQRRLNDLGHGVHLCVLLDDKWTSTADRENFGETLLERLGDLSPDYFCFERDLSVYVDDLNARLSGKAQRELSRNVRKYQGKNGSLPCSVDIALWHFLRLGVLDDHKQILRHTRPKSEAAADLAVSILGERNIEYEDVASSNILKHFEPAIRNRVWRIYFPEDADHPFDDVSADNLVQTETKEFLACPQS